MNTFTRYHQAIAFLESLANLPLDGDYMIDRNNPEMYLKRMRYFLDLIGSPDKYMKFVHITGTAGKGTVTTMMHEILLASGKNVGSFTSPSVTSSIEKIKVGKLYIDPDEFADIVDYLKPFIDKAYLAGPYGRPSYFELFFAIALIYFKRQKCEWVILEVGLGGRYDATNVIVHPVITAITNIDYDHTELLGNTLLKIAHDKAGIIKASSAFFTSEQRPELLKLFKKICTEKKVASIHFISHQTTHVGYNEALASATARYLKISEAHILKGINNTRLPGRFEMIQENPVIILDGAHNRSKIKSTLDNIQKIEHKKLILIIAISNNKDHLSILEQIIPHADVVLFTRFQNKDRVCAHPKELFIKSKKYLKKKAKTKVFLDPNDAFFEVLRIASADDLVLITGSFFLVGELRTYWYPESWILKNRRSFRKGIK